jgi:hypothetical protein
MSGGALAARSEATPAAQESRIDRRALVTRHDPVLRAFDTQAPLSVGNGSFAFTADVTGLQTFAGSYDQTIPLGTLSDWGWHTAPNPEGYSIESYRFEEFESRGRKVGYADISGERTPEIDWLRQNPHRLHLGRIAFVLERADGESAVLDDLTDIEQRLHLWEGRLSSHFRLDGGAVDVETIVHPESDVIAVRVVSALVKSGRIAVRVHFPYGTGGMTAADWGQPEAHTTRLQPGRDSESPGSVHFARRLDADEYSVDARWSGRSLTQASLHDYVVLPDRDTDTFELVIAFSPASETRQVPSFGTVRSTALDHWQHFWSTGGAVELSGSRDPRWRELERRIVLSQYLTAIQSAGRTPPQESGLTFNSWNGKFHLEMHFWHAAQFALWGRLELLDKSLDFYESILPQARATARRQGYGGARWPKMTDPAGAESPSSIGPFLVWQQPHPIYYAELVYRARGDRATLERFRAVVFETAEFMASFAAWDEAGQRYVLGPPLQCAQERFPEEATFNCTFEVVYWRYGLEMAQRWRERLGLGRDADWDRVLEAWSTPALDETGRYLFAETAPDSYTNPRLRTDHPAVTAALGVLPGPGVDASAMSKTLDWIWDNWAWEETWGWDYPMVAMTAARLGQPKRAIEALLMDAPKNHFRPNGHNHQREGLTVYLPGNGGLLMAVALMARGWDGGPRTHAPGFPVDGSWSVRHEGLSVVP